jgi:hypothetical protein
MKRLILFITVLINFKAFALDFCHSRNPNGVNTVIISNMGRHAIVALNFCTYTATGDERCTFTEASYFIESTHSTRAETIYQLSKEDGNGSDKLTVIKKIHYSRTCGPRIWPCDDVPQTTTKYVYTVQNEDGSKIFGCVN